MKQLAAIVVYLCSSAVAVWAFSGGPDPRKTGGPFPCESVCIQCHTGVVNSGPGNIRFSVQPYRPGERQRLQITMSDPNQTRWGFQLSARFAAAPHLQAGSFEALDFSVRVISADTGADEAAACRAGTLQYASHTAPGTRRGTTQSVTWEVDWIPPNVAAGPIIFAAAGNAADGLGTELNDRIYTFQVTVQPAAATSAPRIYAGGVVGGGLSNPAVRQVAPGGIISIFGENFAPPGFTKLVESSDLENGRLPERLAGVCVDVGPERGRLFFVSANQINVQAPAGLTGSTAAVSVILNCGAAGETRTSAETVAVQSAAPEFFSFVQNPDGRNPVAATHAVSGARLGSPALASRFPSLTFTPAKPGDFVTLYATGLGATDPPFAAGVLPGSGAATTQKVSVSLNGVPLADADVLYAGVTPGFAGLYQINIRIPANPPDGDVEVLLRMGAVTSPRGSFLTMRGATGGGGGSATAVANIEVSALQSYVLAARTLQLAASATTLVGASVPGFQPEWRSMTPAIATVDANGLVRGVAPGIVEIRASAPSGVFGRISLRVYPGRVSVEPDPLAVDIGAKATLTAQALDANGVVLPGLRFQWSSSLPAVATVDSSGVITGVQKGSTTISARLDLGIPGFDFAGQSRVTVRPRPDYRLTRLLSSDTLATSATIRNIYNAAFAGADTVAMLVDLSNGSRAVLLSRGGVLQTLAISGQYLDSLGQILHDLNQISVNARGDVLLFNNFLADGCTQTLLLFSAGQPPAPVVSGCSLSWSGGVVADNGDIYYALNADRRQDLMLRKADGTTTRILSSSDNALGMGLDSGISPAFLYGNTLLFTIGNPRGWAWFAWDGATTRRIYGQNEVFGSHTINGGGTPWPGQSGEFFAQVWGPEFGGLFKFGSGTPSMVLNGGENFGGITFFNFENLLHVRGAEILAQVNTNQGRYVARYNRSTGAMTFLVRLDNAWANLGYLAPGGDAFVLTAGGSVSLTRYSAGGQATLANAGRSLGTPANTSLRWENLARTSTVAAPLFRSSNSVVRVAAGSAQALASTGSALLGGLVMTGLGTVASARNGDLAFCVHTDRGSGLVLYRGGRFSYLLDPEQREGPYYTSGAREINWIPCWDGVATGLNTKGQMAALAGVQGAHELTVFADGSRTGQFIARQGSFAPGGSSYQWFADTVAVDENGRVLYIAQLQDGSGGTVFFWEGGSARRLLHQSGNAPSGGKFQGAWMVIPQGTKFFVGMNTETGREIAEFDGTRWRTVLKEGGGLSFGRGRFALSPAGDLFYTADVPDGRQIRVLRTDGRTQVVASQSERTPDGDWMLQFFDVVGTDRNDMFFTALIARAGQKERIALFQATPQ